MDDVRGRFLGLPHGTTPAAVTTNKNIKMSSFESSENIQKKEGGPDRSLEFFYVLICCFTSTVSSWCHVGIVSYLTTLFLGKSPVGS